MELKICGNISYPKMWITTL